MNRLGLGVVVLVLVQATGCSDSKKGNATVSSGNNDADASTSADAASFVRSAAELGGCVNKDCGPNTSQFFDNAKVAKLKLTFREEYTKPFSKTPDQWLDLIWDKWNSHCGPYEWVPVDMEYESPDGVGNVTLERVGIRMRGSKARGANPLAGFKLDFNEFLAPGSSRRFADLSRFEGLSNEKDPSNMVQCMTYKLVRDFGVPAPLCNHVQVIVNGTVYGLMESVERGKDGRYLKYHFGTTDGSLYAGSASCGYGDSLGDFSYKGDTFNSDYAATYEILQGTPEQAQADLIPMLQCADATTTPDDQAFKTCIQEWMDVDQWLRLIAAESLIPTVEDLVGARRNFFLFFQPDGTAPHGGKMRVWGWDYDTALHKQSCYPRSCDPFTAVTGWYGPRGTRAKFIQRLTTVFKPEYCALMNKFLAEVYLPEKVDAMAAVLEPAVAQDPVLKPDTWTAEVTKMREYMVTQKAQAQGLVDAACK